jgi:hypothetical protein
MIFSRKKDMTKDNIVNTRLFYERQAWDLFEFCKEENKEVYDEFRGITRSQTRFRCFIVRKYKFYLYKYVFYTDFSFITGKQFFVILFSRFENKKRYFLSLRIFKFKDVSDIA